MNPELAWLVEWFSTKGAMEKSAGTEVETVNMFDAGWIDSFGVIDLITDIENHFGIRFSEQHFQDRRFPTLGGLSEIIKETKESKEST